MHESLIAALLLSVSAPALADNIAGCEVVLMERIAQEGLEGSAEVASFRPAAEFIASAYDEDADVLREIDGLPIRAIICKRKSVVPSETDFPIVATGTPFMISQNFDSTETGLTTIYFKDGELRSSYKGPELSDNVKTEMEARLKEFNAKPHDLAEKEQAMLDKKASKETSTDEALDKDDTPAESTEKEIAPAKESVEAISPEEHEALK